MLDLDTVGMSTAAKSTVTGSDHAWEWSRETVRKEHRNFLDIARYHLSWIGSLVALQQVRSHAAQSAHDSRDKVFCHVLGQYICGNQTSYSGSQLHWSGECGRQGGWLTDC
jgi:hypothetical protein